MKQLEWKCCDKCGEMVIGVYCFKCGTLNIVMPKKRIISKEYLEVVKQEINYIGLQVEMQEEDGYIIAHNDNESFDWRDIVDYADGEIEDGRDNVRYFVMEIEDIDTIEKLSQVLTALSDIMEDN